MRSRAQSTGKYVHEDEAEEHSKAMNAVPVHGFYRVWTREQDLGLLFVTLVAFARTEATDDRGGTYKTILGTLKNQD